jgi:hypothetical protein
MTIEMGSSSAVFFDGNEGWKTPDDGRFIESRLGRSVGDAAVAVYTDTDVRTDAVRKARIETVSAGIHYGGWWEDRAKWRDWPAHASD